MKKTRILLMLLLVGGIFIGLPQSLVEAAELQFSVDAILPENQVDNENTYFDLRMKPGEKQTVEVELTSSAEKEIEVEMRIAAADTGVNGVIDYPNPAEGKVDYDKTLKYPLQEIAKIQSSVKIPPKEKIKVPIEITMPAEEYKGMIIGGIEFEQKADVAEKGEDQPSGGMGVKNKFVYLLGMKLTENDAPVSVDLKLLDVYAGQLNHRNVIYANLQNPEPEIMRNLQIEAKVYPKGSNEAIYETKKDNMQMAPNTNFEFPISLDNKAFKAGRYLLKMAATADEDKQWEFTKEFEITAEKAKKLNEASVDELEYEPNWWLWIGIGIGVVILLIILIVVFVVVAKKRKKARRKAARNKREMKKNGQSSQSNSDGASANSKKKRKKSSDS